MKKKLSVLAAGHHGIAGLLITVILVGLGERIGERFLPVYLVSIGASLFAPSLLNGLDNFLSAVYSFPGGWLSAKIGYKKALFYFNLFAITGYIIVILFPGWLPVIIGSVFFLSWSSLSMPAFMDLIQHEMPKNKQVLGVSLHSLIKRIPIMLGPLIGGAIIDTWGIVRGIRIAFVIATVFGILACIVQQRILAPDTGHTPVAIKQILSLRKFPPHMRTLLAADVLAKFCSQILYAYTAVWVMKTEKGVGLSAMQFGILSAVETAVAIFIYIPAGLFGDRLKKKSSIMTTFVLYALFPVMLYYARTFALLVPAFIVRGLKEFGEPARKTQIMDFAPDGEKALYFGVYYFYRDIIVTLGVFLGGALWLVAPELNFAAAGLFGLAAVVLYGIRGDC